MERISIVGVVGAIAVALWSAAAAAQPFVYVADLRSDDVLVIDTGTLATVASLPFADDPDGMAVSPDGRRVYVAGFVSNTVGVIDAETHQLLTTVPVGAGPVGLAVTPDGARVYVTQRGEDSVAAIGVASGTVEAVIPVGRGPNAIAITPDGTTAFVTNSFAPREGEVSVLDLATDTVRNTITVGRKPNRVAITPDGRTAYVTNFRSWTSTAIDVASEAVRTTFRAGYKSSAVAVNPNGVWAYVGDGRNGQLLIVDVSVDQVTRAIDVGSSPSSIGIQRNGGIGYVSDFGEDNVHVVDLGDEALVADVAVGTGPFAVAVNCVGDGCNETPYTPKPTRTATDTPTWTPTPTRTETATATATASPTRTLASGQSPVLFALTVPPTTSGGFTQMSMELDAGGQSVTGIREQIILPNGVTFDEAFGDCSLVPQIEAHAEFHMRFDACGTFCNVLSVSIDFDQPFERTAPIYTCFLFVDWSSPIGTLRLRHFDNTALDADGSALPSRGRDGVLVVAPPVSPSPDLTQRPTRTPTPAPPPVGSIGSGPITARPGDRVTLNVRLASDGRAIAGTQNDIELPEGFAVAARGTHPDCTVNPDIDKNASAFSFQPPGCTPGVTCSAIRALILSFDEPTSIPDGATLYTCALLIRADVSPGAYALRVTNTGGSTPGGAPLVLTGADIAVTVQGAAAVRRAAAAALRVCSGGTADGAICAVDADCPAGACVRPQGICAGGEDDGLLCDCPGGTCRAGAASCGSGSDAGVCADGSADGACCDRTFTCRGGSACTATHRLCATGPAKGSPCLADGHCLGSTCVASRRRCAGGEFDGVACIDSSDCPAAACVEPNAPTPTATPIEWLPGDPVKSPDSCAIAPTGRSGSAGWLALPALLLFVRRRRLA